MNLQSVEQNQEVESLESFGEQLHDDITNDAGWMLPDPSVVSCSLEEATVT